MNTKTFRLSRLLQYLAVILVSAVAAVPFLWMVSSSFKQRAELFTYPPVWLPRLATLANYRDWLPVTSLATQVSYSSRGTA